MPRPRSLEFIRRLQKRQNQGSRHTTNWSKGTKSRFRQTELKSEAVFTYQDKSHLLNLVPREDGRGVHRPIQRFGKETRLRIQELIT